MSYITFNQPKLKSCTDKEWAEYHRMRAVNLESELNAARAEVQQLKTVLRNIDKHLMGDCKCKPPIGRCFTAMRTQTGIAEALAPEAGKEKS